jgi:CheY-like chemotaxis protein
VENKKVVLSIDDNPQQLQEFKAILGARYDFRAVKAASEAISFLNANKVDIILLDILMPNISGFEFLDDIRKIPSYMDVPIIIVSGNTDADFMTKARSSKTSAVLAKPVSAEVLINSIEKALAKE